MYVRECPKDIAVGAFDSKGLRERMKKVLLFLKRKWIPALYVILFFFSIFIALLTIKSEENVKLGTGKGIAFATAWHYKLPDGREGDTVIPTKFSMEDINLSECYYLSNRLPDVNIGMSYYYYARHTTTRIFIDGELRYDTQEANGDVKTWFPMQGAFYCEVPLQAEDSGKEIVIEISGGKKNYYTYVGDDYLGDRGNFVIYMMQSDIGDMLGVITLIVIGLILFVLWFVLTFVTKASYNECLCLSLFMLSLSLWLCTEVTCVQFFIQKSKVYSVLAYEMLMIIPIPMMLYYTYGYRPKTVKRLGKIGTLFFMAIWGIAHVLHLAKVVDLSETLPVSQTFLCLGAIYMTVMQIMESVHFIFHRSKNRSIFYMFPLFGTIVLIPVTFFEVWLYLTGRDSGKGTIVMVTGFIFYVLSLTVDSSLKMVSENEKIQRVSKSKSLFLANMSHEIRTPLNAILGFDELLLREAKDEQTREYAIKIHAAGDNLKNIINSILDISKIESGRMEIYSQSYKTIDLLDGLFNNVKSQAEKKGLEVIGEIDENLPEVLVGDEGHLREVIINILSNAVKYTKTGSIRLCVKLAQISPKKKSCRLYVSVKDTGIGIKPADRERMFEKFERLDTDINNNIEGTGLGMSIIVSLLKAMDSEIHMQSEYGVGSDFYFEIEQGFEGDAVIGKYEEGKSFEKQDVGILHTFVAPDARILIVDDVPLNLQVEAGILSPLNMQIDLAESGKEAIEKICSEHYDLVLMDHMMPGMDGIEATNRIRQMGHERDDDYLINLPILALTANAVSGMRDLFLSQGMQDFISKPVESEELMLVIRRWLPKDKIKRLSQREVETIQGNEGVKQTEEWPEIPGIDLEIAKRYCGKLDMFLSNIRRFCESIPATEEKIRTYLESGDHENYTITVHGLKSASKVLGAMEISEQARDLEEHAHKGEYEYSCQNTKPLLDSLLQMEHEIKVYFEETGETEECVELSQEEYQKLLLDLKEAAEAFDMDALMAIEEKMSHIKVPEEKQEELEHLRELVRNVAFMDIVSFLEEIL